MLAGNEKSRYSNVLVEPSFQLMQLVRTERILENQSQMKHLGLASVDWMIAGPTPRILGFQCTG
jgi:hypothetical protein